MSLVTSHFARLSRSRLQIILRASCSRVPTQEYNGFHKYWGKKPVEPLRALISILSEEDEFCSGPFLGAGPIATEACLLQRRFIGNDVNPIALELTEFFLNPVNGAEYSTALRELEKHVKADIQASYAHPTHGVTSHLLWENGSIQPCGKPKSAVEMSAVLTNLILIWSRYSRYQPRRLPKLRLFKNGRINTSEPPRDCRRPWVVSYAAISRFSAAA